MIKTNPKCGVDFFYFKKFGLYTLNNIDKLTFYLYNK